MSENRTTTPTLPSHDQVICTLFEKDFHYGVAVLVNSLVQAGFRGLIWAGYRGEIPAWTEAQPRLSNGLLDLGGATLGLEKIEIGKHFGQFKPDFMESLICRGIARSRLWYFDPDITVRASWSFFERWLEFGVALCQEITMGTMPSNHPLRCEWMRLARDAGWRQPVRQLDRYYNSGFVGLRVELCAFLKAWQKAVGLANSSGVKDDTFQKGKREQTFYTVDQDSLNIASMYAEVPLSTVGPEGMGFIPGGFLMYHSVGRVKPWRKNFLTYALKGIPPSNADKHYLACAEGPIRPYATSKLRKVKIQASIGSAIGRFYQKT